MDCVDEDEADIEEEEEEEVGGCPILATGLCKSSELSMRVGGGGGWGRREDARGDESVGRLLLLPLLVPLVLVLLVVLLLLEPFLEGGLLGLLLMLGDRSLSIAA